MMALSFGGMTLLAALEATLPPPKNLPYLHPTLNALFSCANLTVAFGLGVYWQWQMSAAMDSGHGGVRAQEMQPRREAELKKKR